MAALTVVFSGCSSDDAAERPSATQPSETTTTAASEAVDQSAPDGANGIKVASDGALWIASLNSDQILRVDAADGTILRRVATPPGSGPDDVVIAEDGSVYWTGYLSGAVGKIDAGSDVTTVIANVGPGANPIASRGDGQLVVGRAGGGTGLFAIDPNGEAPPMALGDPGNLNSFDITPDGAMYAPSLDAGSVIEVDPHTGETVRTIATVDGVPIALRWHDGELYVLVLGDTARVLHVDPMTGTVEEFGDTALPAADNLAVDGEGTVFVTGLSDSTVTVLGADGRIERTMRIGS